MTMMFKTLAAASVMTAMAGHAAADNTFTAKFSYSPTASVEATYKQFEQTARRACQINPRVAGGIGMKMKIEEACQAQLMEDAVKATQLETLITYHEQQTNPSAPDRQFAELD